MNRWRLSGLGGVLSVMLLGIGSYLFHMGFAPTNAVYKKPGRLTSIAVLPFANVSEHPGNDYFSIGLSDEILNTLGQVKGLDVVARTSYAVTGMDDVREIGRRLNVDSIVEGTVRKAGNWIRVNVQLIDAASGFDMWSGHYDRDLGDVFAVQEEIAESILEALGKHLDIALVADVPAPDSTKLQAFDLYLLIGSAARLAVSLIDPASGPLEPPPELECIGLKAERITECLSELEGSVKQLGDLAQQLA